MNETKSNLKENAISDEYHVEHSHLIRSNKTLRTNKNQNTNHVLSETKLIQQLPKLNIVSESNGLLNSVILQMDNTEIDKTKSKKSYKKIKYILNDMISELKGMLRILYWSRLVVYCFMSWVALGHGHRLNS